MKTINLKCKNCGSSFDKSIYEYQSGVKKGYSNFFCRNECSCEFNRKILLQTDSKLKHEKEYLISPKLCLNCHSIIPYDKRKNKYCSSKCSAFHTQQNGGHRQFTKEDKEKSSQKAKEYCQQHQSLKSGTYIKCPNCENEFYKTKNGKRICCCRKCYDEWIVKTGYLKGKNGGYRPNSGTSKKGWYKGYFCGSSWELAWVIYNLDHNILFKRNHKGFDYQFEGKTKKYYPDFIIGDAYIEIKGYHSKQFDAKMAQFPLKLKVLHKKELENILEYATRTYGKDFVSMYEKTKTT